MKEYQIPSIRLYMHMDGCIYVSINTMYTPSKLKGSDILSRICIALGTYTNFRVPKSHRMISMIASTKKEIVEQRIFPWFHPKSLQRSPQHYPIIRVTEYKNVNQLE